MMNITTTKTTNGAMGRHGISSGPPNSFIFSHFGGKFAQDRNPPRHKLSWKIYFTFGFMVVAPTLPW